MAELQSPDHLAFRLLLVENESIASEKVMVAVTVWPASASLMWLFLFFFNDTATTEIYTLSLHDALPILAATWVLPATSLAPETLKVMSDWVTPASAAV